MVFQLNDLNISLLSKNSIYQVKSSLFIQLFIHLSYSKIMLG